MALRRAPTQRHTSWCPLRPWPVPRFRAERQGQSPCRVAACDKGPPRPTKGCSGDHPRLRVPGDAALRIAGHPPSCSGVWRRREQCRLLSTGLRTGVRSFGTLPECSRTVGRGWPSAGRGFPVFPGGHSLHGERSGNCPPSAATYCRRSSVPAGRSHASRHSPRLNTHASAVTPSTSR